MESPHILYVIAGVLQLSAVKGFRCGQPFTFIETQYYFLQSLRQS